MKKLIALQHIVALQAFSASVFNSSSALSSQGMTLGVGDAASPEVFSAISEISNIDGPGGQANEIDVTDLDSTAKEFILGLQDEGDITIDINYIPGNTRHAALRADRSAGTQRNYRISFTDSPVTTWTFAALVKGFSISNGVDGKTTASVTLRVSGAITEA